MFLTIQISVVCELLSIKFHAPKEMLVIEQLFFQDFDLYMKDCVGKLPEDQRNGTFLIRDSQSRIGCKVGKL